MVEAALHVAVVGEQEVHREEGVASVLADVAAPEVAEASQEVGALVQAEDEVHQEGLVVEDGVREEIFLSGFLGVRIFVYILATCVKDKSHSRGGW